jgi:two-component system, OmpR family, phosphate regulon sensor histidine kinase PhoR
VKRSYFRKLFILYVIILALALIGSEIFISTTVRESHLDELAQNLSRQIDIMSDQIVFSRNSIDRLCNDLRKKSGARVTIILADGTVIGDSDSASVNLDNHAQRTEIAQARLSGTGRMIRHSSTLKTDFLYFAKKIASRGEPVGFIRLAVPLTDIDRTVSSLRINYSIILMIALLLMWLFALWQTERLRRLIRQLRELSSSLAEGDIDKRLFMNKGGEFSKIASNLVAVSEKLRGLLKQSEEERNHLNAILKSIPDSLLIIDRKGTILLANAAAATLFSDTPLTGAHYMEVFRSNSFSELLEGIRRKPDFGSVEIRLDTPAERHFNVLVSPLYYDKMELSEFVIVFHDITKIEKLEQMRRDFVANISHEIKTPITAIKGFSDTLLDGAIDDRENAARFVGTIRQNSERINNLVDDLLTLSQIELGVITIEKSGVDIADVLDQVMSLLEAKARDKGLELDMAVNSDLSEIDADRNRLIQIFTNLVDNGIKFTESGRITFGSAVEDGRPLLFVRDTGIGIPLKHLPRLGERFYRVDSARSRKMGGTGLGLAIVKHLVKAHGWDMRIDSSPDTGTFIRIYL